MDKLITLVEFLKIGIPAKSSVLGHILDYFCNEVDSNPVTVAKMIMDGFERVTSELSEADIPMEDFIETEYGQNADITCELCGKPLYEQLWQDGRHIECSAHWADVQASGHGDW